MYRSRVRSGVSLTCGGASKARYKRSKSLAFDFELPGRPAIVARLGFGGRRAVTLLLCLGIFRLQGKSALTSMFEAPGHSHFWIRLLYVGFAGEPGFGRLTTAHRAALLRDNIEPA